ncbi:hypothetical protein RND81_01G076300 [Saponaria officinalis]|uniref:Uncharacterized protein n=1 Tax=Saponaria officinalis TaxID=3572 RepID=A0AAW1NCT6_SAPOF
MTNSIPSKISPNSDKCFWSELHNRVEAVLEIRKSQLPSSASTTTDGESSRVKQMKEDSMLLIRGFDSIASSLSQLTGNIDNALQGTKDLAKSSAITEIVLNASSNVKKSEGEQDRESENGDEIGEDKKGVKRKLDECCPDDQVEIEKEKHQAEKNLKKVKNLAVSMASKAATLARELKSVKSDMCFLQERCALLEEENRRLRDGFGEGVRPDEDDLVRLQLEALLAEKSRLATENANLTRENQCLRQLVEYHQFATEDLSASYEQVIEGLCLDFSSPGAEDGSAGRVDVDDQEDIPTPKSGNFEFHTPLHKNIVRDDDLVNH